MKLTEIEAHSLASVYNMQRDIKTSGDSTILMAQCLSILGSMLPNVIIEKATRQDDEIEEASSIE